jgi:hypothetical protein
MAFTFQPQNIIANPDIMFFKADTTEHRDPSSPVAHCPSHGVAQVKPERFFCFKSNAWVSKSGPYRRSQFPYIDRQDGLHQSGLSRRLMM